MSLASRARTTRLLWASGDHASSLHHMRRNVSVMQLPAHNSRARPASLSRNRRRALLSKRGPLHTCSDQHWYKRLLNYLCKIADICLGVVDLVERSGYVSWARPQRGSRAIFIWGEKQARPFGVAVLFGYCDVASNSFRTARASSPILLPTSCSSSLSNDAASVIE